MCSGGCSGVLSPSRGPYCAQSVLSTAAHVLCEREHLHAGACIAWEPEGAWRRFQVNSILGFAFLQLPMAPQLHMDQQLLVAPQFLIAYSFSWSHISLLTLQFLMAPQLFLVLQLFMTPQFLMAPCLLMAP